MSSMRMLSGRYQLQSRLGDGGASAVWRGADQELDRPVAVKLLAGGFGGAAQRVLARAEASTAARLSHPHLCQVYDYGESQTETADQEVYLVMELLSGPTLEDRLRAYAMPVRLALRIGAQLASALAAAHGSGLVHRNLKPANVMVTANGPKLVELGFPDIVPAPTAFPDGEPESVLAYLAPERLLGSKPKPASDVHALGLLLHYLLSGAAPWPAESVAQMLESREYRPPAPLPPVEDLPQSVADVCKRCLSEDPHDRPTAHEVARRLGTVLGWQFSRAGEQFIVADESAAEPTPAQTAPEPTPAQTAPEPTPAQTAAEPAPMEAATEAPRPAGERAAGGSRWLNPQRLVEQ